MDHGTAVVGFDIYVIGGCNDVFGGLSTCLCFNAVTKTCRKVALMAERRNKLSVTVLRGAVYAMGGQDGSRIHRTVERYDCKTNKWSLINPMNKQRARARAAVLNALLLVSNQGCVHQWVTSNRAPNPTLRAGAQDTSEGAVLLDTTRPKAHSVIVSETRP
ncbi:kelch-like protein diablo isoform X3 [Zootermopsis nevadensis]|uniref:kelch-like protein diablo isoform X3 n=1 Tax=Zootermopsis nevadensis TaxID=136037 RepID=UPI000B8E3F59|nr:kelch-like protein diablo isoform X3 [Zootermopsis nevadensis]